MVRIVLVDPIAKADALNSHFKSILQLKTTLVFLYNKDQSPHPTI